MAWDQTIDISSVLKLLKKPLMDEHKKKKRKIGVGNEEAINKILG